MASLDYESTSDATMHSTQLALAAQRAGMQLGCALAVD
jgi:hypothetical protein